jgi:hypothetical protein
MGEDALKLRFVTFVIALTACNSAPPIDTSRVLRVEEVIRNIDQLNGKTVRVGGFLGDCFGYDCGLFQDQAEWQEEQRWWKAVNAGDKKAPAASNWLGIGGFGVFDAKAKPFNRSYVAITGRINNGCRYHGKPACTDRADELEPTGISSWTPPQKSTGS